MALRVVSLSRKLLAIEAEITEARHGRRDPGSPEQEHYETLKAIAADIRARIDLPRGNVIEELTGAMQRLLQSKDKNYDEVRLIEVGNVVVSRWPHVSMALERFGEESAE